MSNIIMDDDPLTRPIRADMAVSTQPQRAIVSATPADLVRLALESGDKDIERLERLMAMQERWEATEAKKAYNAAFAAFKAMAVRIIKNRRVDAGPLAGKKYAELFTVVNAATPALSEHGLSASWKLTKDEKDWIEVTCILKHTAGHAESVSMGGPPDVGGAKNAIQARASTVSYLERYTFKAITGLSEQEDDDDGRGVARGESGASDELTEQGEEASTQGTAALTAWWGQLNAHQRGKLQKQFTTWRRAAQQFDGDGK